VTSLKCGVGVGAQLHAGESAPRIVTALEPEDAGNPGATRGTTEFSGRVAFLDLGGRQKAWTADRTEFLGRNRRSGSARRTWTAGTG